MQSTVPPQSQANTPAPGEKTFLIAEAGIAREAMSAAWADAKKNLANGLDPRVWTGAHPIVAISAALVAGFAAACVVVPTKEEQALKKLAELQRAIHGIKPGSPPEKDAKSAAKETEAAARKVGIAGLVSAEVLKVIRPLLTSVISSLVAAKMSPEDAAEKVRANGNGFASPADATPPPT